MSESDLELEPCAKRRRTFVESDATQSDSQQFWFQDGDIVLHVQDRHLKVHQSKLMDSLVFHTMLLLPQPELAERFDDCPLVRLTYDAFHDWIQVLDWMYDRSLFELRSNSLDVMAGALRISTKYEILELRQWCIQRLLSRWPLNIAEMDTTAIPRAAEAICLARELDVPEILPAAFYALGVQRWGNGGDGGSSHLILSPADLRRIIVGREMLHERQTAFLVNWDPRLDAKFFHLCPACEPVCKLWLTERLVPSPHSPYTSWLFRDLHRLSKEGFANTHACPGCTRAFRRAFDLFLAQLEKAVPNYFML